MVVTHGRFGEELLVVAEYIMGRKLGNIRAVRVPFQGELAKKNAVSSATPFADRQQMVREAIGAAMRQVDSGGGGVILADIMGGTAFNCARQILQTGTVQAWTVVAGVNLPMLLKIPSVRALTATEAARELVGRSREAIVMLGG